MRMLKSPQGQLRPAVSLCPLAGAMRGFLAGAPSLVPPPTLTGVPMRNEDAPSHLPRQRRCLVPSSESRYRCCAGLPSRCPNGVLLCPGLLSPTSQLRGLLRVSSRSCSRQQRQLGGVWH